jgi:hypothetical protein
MKHHEWMLITDFRLHLSPLGPNPQRILDIGTGTGRRLHSVSLAINAMLTTSRDMGYANWQVILLAGNDSGQIANIAIAELYPSAEVIGTGQDTAIL